MEWLLKYTTISRLLAIQHTISNTMISIIWDVDHIFTIVT